MGTLKASRQLNTILSGNIHRRHWYLYKTGAITRFRDLFGTQEKRHTDETSSVHRVSRYVNCRPHLTYSDNKPPSELSPVRSNDLALEVGLLEERVEATSKQVSTLEDMEQGAKAFAHLGKEMYQIVRRLNEHPTFLASLKAQKVLSLLQR